MKDMRSEDSSGDNDGGGEWERNGSGWREWRVMVKIKKSSETIRDCLDESDSGVEKSLRGGKRR